VAGTERTTPGALVALEEAESLRLLATQVVGRVAVSDPGGAPLVVPVNFLLTGGRIVFRTDFGPVFRQAVLAERPVSFEVDEFDLLSRTGWSVLVQGRAEELGEWDATSLELRPWASGAKAHWVALAPQTITGRRVALSEPPQGPPGVGYL
jgi:nitroimidazol reductase NimA-like FMN-containing flavoprotein (pyridoxamine 5'-phosphate oxidase superfamily)